MSIRPVDFNGMIQRAEDVGAIKHQEDAKPLVDQANIGVQMEQDAQTASHQVQTMEESARLQNETDAKGEGRGAYTPSGKKKAAAKKKPDGRVIAKGKSGSFDIKI